MMPPYTPVAGLSHGVSHGKKFKKLGEKGRQNLPTGTSVEHAITVSANKKSDPKRKMCDAWPFIA